MSTFSHSTKPVRLGDTLSLRDLSEVARLRRPVQFPPSARQQVDRSRSAIEAIANLGDQGPAVYGVNTGFGALSETRIGAQHIVDLQRNLVRSHACGVGPNLGEPEVRAMMVLRAQVIAQGYSGVRSEVVELLVDMLNAGVFPRVPAQGSVGASGDLAPLAHLALVLMGEGEVFTFGAEVPAHVELARIGLLPVELGAKEGLALINGTQYMTALGALALVDCLELARVADIAAAMSIEALKGSSRPFDERLMHVRPHPGQARVAENLRLLLAESDIMISHKNCSKVQDPYSLRCVPQVHGASRDAFSWAAGVLEREANSVTDNPTVFIDDSDAWELISGGNFHGQPVALALDLAAIAVAELANISERRVEQLVNPALSSGLTPFLAKDSGLHSGLMIAQVAAASLVSENKVLCHPASVDSIPSSAGKEDHVSMGSVGARKLSQIVANVRNGLAIEVLTASVGLDQRRPLLPSRAVRAALGCVRRLVPELDEDRALYRDIAAVAELIESGELVSAVQLAVGEIA